MSHQTTTQAQIKLTSKDIPEGSALSILGQNETTGVLETWYGQNYGTDDNGKVIVALMEKQEDGTFEFSKDGFFPQHFSVETIQQFEPISDMDSMRCHKKAWRKIGLRLIDSNLEQDVFVELSQEETNNNQIPIGDSDSDYESEDDASSFDSLDGFIVRDGEEDEDFTQADPNSSSWVNSFHQDIHDFDNAPVNNARQQQVKDFIGRIERRALQKLDEKRFKQGKCGVGKPALATSQKPSRKKRRKE